MSDVSDPEDEIVDIGPDPPKVAPASVPQHVQHGGCQARRPLNQKPPGADKWSSIYTVYLNKNRTKAQVNKKRKLREVAVDEAPLLKKFSSKVQGKIFPFSYLTISNFSMLSAG